MGNCQIRFKLLQLMKCLKKSLPIIFGVVLVAVSLTLISGIRDNSVNTFGYFVGYVLAHFIVSFLIVYTLTLLVTYILFLFSCLVGKKEQFVDNCYIIGFILATLIFVCYKFRLVDVVNNLYVGSR